MIVFRLALKRIMMATFAIGEELRRIKYLYQMVVDEVLLLPKAI
jgi:hypothetical protein